MSLLRTILHLLIVISIALLPLTSQSAPIRCRHGVVPLSAPSQPCTLAHTMDADHVQPPVKMVLDAQGCKDHCPTCGLCQCGCTVVPGAGIAPSSYHAIADLITLYEQGYETKIGNCILPPPIPPPISISI